MTEGQHGSLGVAAFSPTGETLATEPAAYAVTVHDHGETEINAFSLDIGLVHMNDDDLDCRRGRS